MGIYTGTYVYIYIYICGFRASGSHVVPFGVAIVFGHKVMGVYDIASEREVRIWEPSLWEDDQVQSLDPYIIFGLRFRVVQGIT